MVHHVPIGIVARFLGWFRDFAAMPGRIRKMAEATEGDSDKRLICTSCGVGRITTLRRASGVDGWSNITVGACNHCQINWQVTDDGTRLLNIRR